jgi:AbrB family looped-hinge helix DNA binding protein
MKEVLTVVTRKGQVTVPAEVRKALDLKHGDRVAFVLPEQTPGQVAIRRVGSVVEQTAGAVSARYPAPTAEQLRDIAADAIAQEAVERMGQ